MLQENFLPHPIRNTTDEDCCQHILRGFSEGEDRLREGETRNVEIFTETVVSEHTKRSVRLYNFLCRHTSATLPADGDGVQSPFIGGLLCCPPQRTAVLRLEDSATIHAAHVVYGHLIDASFHLFLSYAFMFKSLLK